MALSGTDFGQLLLAVDGVSDIYDSEKPEDVSEADYREKASHLLDPVGVKASTASLKAQDTAMISVVETLLKKIDRLEEKVSKTERADEAEAAEKLEEASGRDLSKVDTSVAHCLMQHVSEFTPQVMQNQQHAADVVQGWFDEAGIDTPKSREYVAQIRALPKFKSVTAII